MSFAYNRCYIFAGNTQKIFCSACEGDRAEGTIVVMGKFM